MKSRLFRTAFCLFLFLAIKPVSVYCQMDADTRNEIQQVANRVASKLMGCCSSYGGKNLSADVDFDKVNISKLLGEITIPMTVSWRGSWTGGQYWIRGQVIIGKSGQMEWQKQNDSGGFSPGCSNGCIK